MDGLRAGRVIVQDDDFSVISLDLFLNGRFQILRPFIRQAIEQFCFWDSQVFQNPFVNPDVLSMG